MLISGWVLRSFTTYEQAHVGLDLLTQASYDIVNYRIGEGQMSNNFLWNPDVKENGKETGQKEW